MKPKLYSYVFTFVLSLVFSIITQGQTYGPVSSAVWLSDCNQSNFFNTSGSGSTLIGPSGNTFANANLGVHTRNSHTLIMRGAEVRTFKNSGANVCGAKMFYRIYAQSATPGTFTGIDLPLVDDCNASTGQYATGGNCAAGDQKWSQVVDDGTTIPFSPIDLTAFAAGNYVLEVYYQISGSSSSTSLCNETTTLNNGGTNYKANFSVQAPDLSSTNPTTCNGTEGSITISGLIPGVTYATSYSDDGVTVGPINMVANSSGQIIISGLNAGTYSDFTIETNGCLTDFNTGLILTNPVIIPKFNKIAPFCAGSTAPSLPTTSINGITGTWNPAVINNQASGIYTFTPDAGQCGISVKLSVTVNQKVTPTFSFGTSSTICAGASVPTLPATSTNGITGSWSPAVVDNQNSGVYTFTPGAGQCATTTTFTVTVNPNITPVFSFGPNLTICAGSAVPTLATTSDNGITGSWSPATVDNNASGTYTFTPGAGQCATTTTFTVTVNPKQTPTFSFGPTLTICAGETVPTLLNTSDNGITGSWNPAVVDNQNSGTYTFTPAATECANPVTFTVTVNQKNTPTFTFGNSLAICAGEAVPTLPATSINGITGTWNPATVDNQNSGTYTFTPAAGQCANNTTFSVSVTPNKTPVFSFGPSLTICAGESVPTLSNTSDNGITGSWSPAVVDNQTSGTYIFTPSAGQCALQTTFTVTVNPIVTPTFSFGTSKTICAGEPVPTLPNTSDNGVSGTWNPAIVDNNVSATYTFTPSAGQCATSTTFTLTVTAKIVPAFSFNNSLTICAGETVPNLPAVSSNGISGTWNPAVVDNQSSGTYTFTPSSGQCATTTTFVVTVNPNITPVFSFGPNLTICAGANVPLLPTTSDNGISGTWNPAIVDNNVSGTYTFTPTAGQCASTINFNVTVNAKQTPTFSFGPALTICQGESVPMLSSTSDNGISGTWNTAVVDNQTSGTYTFTPAATECANPVTFTVTVNQKINPTFGFQNTLTICEGEAVPSLPTTSDNGIVGSWSPAVVDNQNSGTYTFTPNAGQCANGFIFTVTVNQKVTPTFSFGTSSTICAGASVPTLPATSTNGITGTWSPSVVDNQNNGVYTFTPGAGQCATTTTFTVTVNPNITPVFSFGPNLTICAGSAVPTLATTSDNGITGSWSPATVDNNASGTYTFTPGAGQCATTTTFTVTVNPKQTPTFSFGPTLTICAGETVPTLLNTSDNGITGSWNPAVVDNQNSGTYTFTPAATECANPVTFTVTVNPIVTPTFDFGLSATICSGSTAQTLPSISNNGIAGVWNPSVVNNKNSGVYTFTPNAGQCAITTTFTVSVNANVTPVFNFGPSLTICAGGNVPALSTNSDNGITGTWNPSTVSDQTSGVYTFTPSAGQCATVITFTVTVNPVVTPTFAFNTSLSVCAGSPVPTLVTTSTNGISGTWSPAVVDNQNSGTYTFTPTAGQCATSTTFTLTVNQNVTPTFTFGDNLTICAGDAVPSLPTVSTNGVSGTWNPATVNKQASGTYRFTPVTGQCATTATFTVTVNQIITPTFSFGTKLSICTGADVPDLPTTSDNGIAGTWSPVKVDNKLSGTYTFTPEPVPGQCIAPVIFEVTVNPIVAPIFNFGNTLTVCKGTTPPALPLVSSNGINGTWSPAVINNQSSGVYTFTTTPGQCATESFTLNVTVPPVATVVSRTDTTVTDGAIVPAFNISGTPSGVNFNWINSNTAIGLSASGTGVVPSFIANNKGTSPISSTITITPSFNGCAGVASSYKINVIPLDKDVFVPNVFSPNGDGKNDILYVYGNYIDKVDMRIFNQWGQEIEKIDNKSRGWDGKYKGKAQPVGVYVYVLQAVMTDGRTIKLKGSITLLR